MRRNLAYAFAIALVLTTAGIGATAVIAQEVFPARAITIVAPFPPGGVADLTARPVAAALEKTLKSPVGVVNKTGAAGAVGMQFVATSKADGYTLLLALSSISIIPEADKLFNRTPAFTVDQFAPIALISADPTILVVRAESPWRTAQEFIADAKKRPGEISYSSSGIYGTLHMAMELLGHAAGVKLRHVPAQGAGPALNAILGGHVDALASGPAVVIPHIKAGKLRPLAGWGDKRVAALPDIPTFRELGYPGRRVLHLGGPLRAGGDPGAGPRAAPGRRAGGRRGSGLQDGHGPAGDARHLQAGRGVPPLLRGGRGPARGRGPTRRPRRGEVTRDGSGRDRPSYRRELQDVQAAGEAVHGVDDAALVDEDVVQLGRAAR